VIGAGITTIGILLLVLGCVGASIDVYAQILSAIIQQQLSAILAQLPAALRPQVAASSGGSEPPSGALNILESFIRTLISTPLWLALTVVGLLLIYLGLFVTQQQRPRHQR
jgi:uncharacterized membrane protein